MPPRSHPAATRDERSAPRGRFTVRRAGPLRNRRHCRHRSATAHHAAADCRGLDDFARRHEPLVGYRRWPAPVPSSAIRPATPSAGGEGRLWWPRSAACSESAPACEPWKPKLRAWGGPGIYITRWLLSPLGPWINLASGTAGYPWHRFLFWDTLGELTGAAVYISLGRFFSDRVMALYAVLGDLTWAIGALLAAIILGWQLVVRLRQPDTGC